MVGWERSAKSETDDNLAREPLAHRAASLYWSCVCVWCASNRDDSKTCSSKYGLVIQPATMCNARSLDWRLIRRWSDYSLQCLIRRNCSSLLFITCVWADVIFRMKKIRSAELWCEAERAWTAQTAHRCEADMLMQPNTVTHIRIFHFKLINTYINKEQLWAENYCTKCAMYWWASPSELVQRYV